MLYRTFQIEILILFCTSCYHQVLWSLIHQLRADSPLSGTVQPTGRFENGCVDICVLHPGDVWIRPRYETLHSWYFRFRLLLDAGALTTHILAFVNEFAVVVWRENLDQMQRTKVALTWKLGGEILKFCAIGKVQ